MRIVLSDGHDCVAYGAINRSHGLREHFEAIKVNDIVQQRLEETGVEVIRLNADDYLASFETVKNPAAKSLRWKVDQIKSLPDGQPTWVVETHFNAFNTEARGHEVLYYRDGAYALAQKLEESFTLKLPNSARGVKRRDNLYLLKHSIYPAVIVEPLFIDNDQDAQLLLSTWGRTLVADAIFVGIREFLHGFDEKLKSIA